LAPEVVQESKTPDEPTLDRGSIQRRSAFLARKDATTAPFVPAAAEEALKCKLKRIREFPNYDEWRKSRK
jgi:hypothetical protein